MTNETRDARRVESARRILEAAQQEFSERGFDGATIRGIAQRAGVHASLVMQHYKSKAALFELAVQPTVHDDVAASNHLARVLDIRMRDLPPETRALMRSMLTTPEAEASMRLYLDARVARLAQSSSADDAEARALVIVSSILGLTIARHFLGLSAFETVPLEDIVAAADDMLGVGAALGIATEDPA